MLTTLGIGAAIYGLSRYRNGKYMEPVKNMMNNTKEMVQNAGRTVGNPLMEMSQEFMPNQKMNQQKKKESSKTPINPS